MKVAYLPYETRIAERADLEVLITHEDLTETTANTTQKLTFPIAAKMSVELRARGHRRKRSRIRPTTRSTPPR
jgi:hypothetical protein